MQVLNLTNVLEKTKGYVSRYYIEIAPSTFVGHVDNRTATQIWDYVIYNLGVNGSAVFLQTDNSAQGYIISFASSGNRRRVINVDGIDLIEQLPLVEDSNTINPGWSKASRYRQKRR